MCAAIMKLNTGADIRKVLTDCGVALLDTP
jgi:hypothetical protein